MKRKFTIIFALFAAMILCFVAAACGKTDDEKPPVHEHTYATEWSKNETEHWHAATCEHTSERKDVAEHTWSEGEVTTAATEEADGVNTFVCTVCGEVKTEVIPALGHEHTYSTEWSKNETEHWHAATCKHTSERKDVAEHTWSEGEVTTAATEEADGVNTFVCTVCGEVKTEVIPALGHEHTYSTEWSKNETEHWHAATCKHTGERKDVAAHDYSGKNATVCTVCGFKKAAEDNTIIFNIAAKTYDGTEQKLTENDFGIKGGTVTS